MPMLEVNGTELYYEDTGGECPPVLFSHGLLWSHRMFAPQVEAIRATHRCISYDHRGQGQSAVPEEGTISIETVTADAIALIEALKLAPVHFVGLSMGGFVGMRIAARRPELLRSLTLLETAADPEPRKNLPKYIAMNTVARLGGLPLLAPLVMPIMFGATFLADPDREELRNEWTAELKKNPKTIVRAVNGVLKRSGVSHELGAIRCPTLVVHAAEDKAISASRMRALHEGIAGSRFVQLPRGGHTATIEEPAAMNGALLDFLGSL